MKKLNEKLSLLRMAQVFGVEPDPKLLEEIQRLKQQQEQLRARVHAASQQLFETNPQSNPYKRLDHYPDGNPIPDKLPDLYQSADNKMVPAGQNCHNCLYMQDNGGCSRWGGAQVRANYWCAKWKAQKAKTEELINTVPVLEGEETQAQRLIDQSESTVDKVVKAIAESTVVNPEPGLVPKPADPLAKKVDLLERWISRIAATGPGGGEVNLRWLDDVDRSTIADDYYLRYEATSKKFVFDAGHKNNFYLAAQSTVTQTSSATSATAMTFNVIDYNLGISVGGVNSSGIIIAAPGTYNLQFSSQFINSANDLSNVYIWLRQNGTDVIGSNGVVTIPHKDNANTPGKIVTGWNYYVTTTSVNETIQLMWFVTDNVNTSMVYLSSVAATASTPFIPATASVILTVSPVKVDSY